MAWTLGIWMVRLAAGLVPGAWCPGGHIRVLGLANSESKFILYETYTSIPTCHILAGSLSGSGYGTTDNIPTPTVPDGHNKCPKIPMGIKIRHTRALIGFLPIGFWVAGTHCHL
jgi:hypothetical protein